MTRRFLLRWLINFLGLWAAAALISGIQYGAQVRVLIVASLIFSIVNACIRPLVVVLALPAIVLTLGLFIFVVNAFMLYLVTVFYHHFHIASFRQAIEAALIIWVVNYLLTDVLEGGRRETAV
jgi:putative membrane protein